LKDALAGWEQRYKGAGELHYREEVCYADSVDRGFYTVTFDVAADASRQVWYCDFSLQLAGMPLDPQPLYELCRTLGDREPAYLKTRPEPSLERSELRSLKLRSMPAVAYFVTADELHDRP
jgi:hypothetical protein